MWTNSNRWVATTLFIQAFYVFTLNMMHWQYLLTCSLALTAILGQKKWSHIKCSILSSCKWPTSSWQPFKVISRCLAGSTSWNSTSWDPLIGTLQCRMPPQLEMVVFLRSCLSLAWSVNLIGHWPNVLYRSFLTTSFRTGSASWACHQSLFVVHKTVHRM